MDCEPARGDHVLMNAHAASTLGVIWVLVMLSGCASNDGDRIGFEEARTMFAGRGVQPGQPLPKLSLVDLEGHAVDLSKVQAGRPMVLVTASLTCNVARRQQKNVDELREHYGDSVAVVVIYTIDAHPKGNPCPYTGKEWVPKDNERDAVLVKQPTTLDERLAVARQFRQRFSNGATVFVDTMDNASWQALGKAPNLGLLVDERGIVKVRQGWFDPKAMDQSLDATLMR